MSTTFLSQALHGKPIISVTNGKIVAQVVEILIDPNILRVAAAVTSKGGLLKRRQEMEVIPADEVQVWGQDAVLVKRPDVIATRSELPGSEQWRSVSNQVKGHAVIGTDGTRIGQLDDVVIDVNGQLVAYDLAQAFVVGEDRTQAMKHIPAQATSALGKDVLIVDTSKIVAIPELEELAQVEEPVMVEEPIVVEEKRPPAEENDQAGFGLNL